MGFDYESSTKNAYKDPAVASEYHAAFTERVTWKTYRAHFIAKRERRIISAFLDQLRPKTVLDIPCGTGKLAPIFAAHGCRVHAADISPDMLEIAKATYERSKVEAPTFGICDIERVGEQYGNAALDAVVCLRLMHRIPADVRRRALESISRAAPSAIVSFGISSPYHRFRKKLRNMVFGEPDRDLCQEDLATIREDLGRHFEIKEMRSVSAVLSEEVIFLLQSRKRCVTS